MIILVSCYISLLDVTLIIRFMLWSMCHMLAEGHVVVPLWGLICDACLEKKKKGSSHLQWQWQDNLDHSREQILHMSMALRLLGPKADDQSLEEEDASRYTWIFTCITAAVLSKLNLIGNFGGDGDFLTSLHVLETSYILYPPSSYYANVAVSIRFLGFFFNKSWWTLSD
jgi:hypothetical protein